MNYKTVKLKSYEELQKNKQQQLQNEIQQLLSNGASEDNKNSNTYKDRDDYHRAKEKERLLQLIAAAESQGNIIKVKEYRSELDKFNVVCKKKERSRLIKELKSNIKELYYSFIRREQTNKNR